MQYRTMCVVRITLLLGGILCVEAAFAKTDSGVFKLEEVIELAMERNPVVAGAAATVKQARGERVIAGAYPNPSITGGLGPGRTREALGDVRFLDRDVSIDQPLEWPGMRKARQQAAEAGLAGAAAALDEARLIVLADVKVAFYQLLLAQRDLELTMQTLTLAQDLYRSIQARVDAGQARPFEAIKANVEVQKMSKDLSRAENTLVAARVKLDRLTSGGLGADFTIQGDFESSRRPLNRQDLITYALEQHPTLRRLGKLSERAEHSITQERQSVIPSVTVSGLFRQEAAETAYLGQLSVPLPLWYRRQGHIAAAIAAKERTEADRVRAQNELVTAITEHAQEVRTASQQIDVFEKGLLKQAEEALRIARISFQQGAAGILDLIDAQRVYRQMLLEYAEARAALSIALARLERWTGALR
jgi:cobalt-zinc-cadmium efflux system outer membrane protein